MILSSLYMPILTIDQNEPSHYTFSQDENQIFILLMQTILQCFYCRVARTRTMKDSERQDFLRVRPPQARIPSKRTKMDTQDEIARRNRLRNSWSVRISLGQIVYYDNIIITKSHMQNRGADSGIFVLPVQLYTCSILRQYSTSTQGRKNNISL